MKLNLLYEAEEGHTCRFPPSGPDDEGQLRRNSKTCSLCDRMYEALLDAELGVMPTGQEVALPGEVEAKPGETFKQQRVSRPGRFGTGRPAPVSPEDSPLMQLLKRHRDMGGEEWSRRGEERFGERIRSKAKCSWRHSCSDPSLPMPDPFATKVTGGPRHNEWFTDAGPDEVDPRVPAIVRGEKTHGRPYLISWPISGLSGKKPKDEYADRVYNKLDCPVCSGRIEGCDNPVSTMFSRAKPLCSEHVKESPYPEELLQRYGGPGLPDAPDDAAEVAERWREYKAEELQVGDRVVVRQRNNQLKQGFKGTGPLVGELLEIDPEMEDRTHRVKWENPKAVKTPITWVDPEDLDIWNPMADDPSIPKKSKKHWF